FAHMVMPSQQSGQTGAGREPSLFIVVSASQHGHFHNIWCALHEAIQPLNGGIIAVMVLTQPGKAIQRRNDSMRVPIGSVRQGNQSGGDHCEGQSKEEYAEGGNNKHSPFQGGKTASDMSTHLRENLPCVEQAQCREDGKVMPDLQIELEYRTPAVPGSSPARFLNIEQFNPY